MVVINYKGMKLSSILTISLILMGLFALLHISIFFDLYRQDGCLDEYSITKCDYILQKIYIILLLCISTLVVVVLQFLNSPKLFLLNAVIGVVAILSVVIYLAALLSSQNFKNISVDRDVGKYFQELFVFPVMIELGFTVSLA